MEGDLLEVNVWSGFLLLARRRDGGSTDGGSNWFGRDGLCAGAGYRHLGGGDLLKEHFM